MILNMSFLILTFLSHLSIFLKKLKVGRHERFLFSVAIKHVRSVQNRVGRISGNTGVFGRNMFSFCNNFYFFCDLWSAILLFCLAFNYFSEAP